MVTLDQIRRGYAIHRFFFENHMEKWENIYFKVTVQSIKALGGRDSLSLSNAITLHISILGTYCGKTIFDGCVFLICFQSLLAGGIYEFEGFHCADVKVVCRRVIQCAIVYHNNSSATTVSHLSFGSYKCLTGSIRYSFRVP